MPGILLSTAVAYVCYLHGLIMRHRVTELLETAVTLDSVPSHDMWDDIARFSLRNCVDGSYQIAYMVLQDAGLVILSNEFWILNLECFDKQQLLLFDILRITSNSQLMKDNWNYLWKSVQYQKCIQRKYSISNIVLMLWKCPIFLLTYYIVSTCSSNSA